MEWKGQIIMDSPKLFLIYCLPIFLFIFLYWPKITYSPDVKQPSILTGDFQSNIPNGQIDAKKLGLLINKFRQDSYLDTITPTRDSDNALCKFAKTRLNEVKLGWSHNGFRKHTKDCDFELCKAGYDVLGENLAQGFYSEEAVLQAWINSLTHLAILKSDYDEMCIVSGDGYVVLNLVKY